MRLASLLLATQVFVDYDQQLGALGPPTVGSGFWHSPVNPGSSGQNRNVGKYDDPTTGTGTNLSRVTSTMPPGLGSGNGYELRWSFRGADGPYPSGDTLLRVFSNSTTSPILDLTRRLQVDVYSRHPIRIALVLSESACTAQPGQFENVGSNLQVVGGIGENALQASGSMGGWVLRRGWQTLDVDFSQITANRGLSGTGEDGQLNPASPGRAALNGFLFSPLASESGLQLMQEVYLDNWRFSG